MITAWPEPGAPVALVTGATSGIGVAIAQRLAADGYTVVLTGRDRDRGNAAADTIGAAASFVAVDLTGPDAARSLISHVAGHHGRLDALVNNAGADHTGDLIDLDRQQIEQLFEINTYTAIALTQQAAPVMLDGGSIINVTSRLASVGVPTMALYSATKGALQAFTTAAAVELAPRNIRVNAVAPGMTHTPLYEAWLKRQPDPAISEREVLDGIPLGRLARPTDVAAAVSFLASVDAAYITGITIPVDGGYTAR